MTPHVAEDDDVAIESEQNVVVIQFGHLKHSELVCPRARAIHNLHCPDGDVKGLDS
jgi:hypothetical protein